MNNFSISGNIVDVVNKKIFAGTINVSGERIESIIETPDEKYSNYIIPDL